jgi:hypothetical protein
MAQICSGLFGTGHRHRLWYRSCHVNGPSRRRRAHARIPPDELPPEEQHDEDIVDSALWHALLASFYHARALRVRAALAGDLSHALQPADGPTTAGKDIKPGPVPEVPLLFLELCMVVLLHGDNDDDDEKDYEVIERWWGISPPRATVAMSIPYLFRMGGSVGCEHRHHWFTEGW